MLLKRQINISPQRGLPVDSVGASQSTITVPAETVQLYYYNSGVQTADAGEAVGTIVVGKLVNSGIKNELGSMTAVYNDTSLSFTSTALTNERAFPFDFAEATDDVDAATRAERITSGFSNGDYTVDYVNGLIYGVKASTQTSLTSTTYKIQKEITGGGGGVAEDVNVIPPSTILDGATTVTTAGTPVALGASTAIKSLLIQADPSNTGLIYVGNASSQSIELSAGDIYAIDIDNLSKVYIDSSVNGEGVAYNATA